MYTFDYTLFAPILLSSAIGFAILCIIDTRSRVRNGEGWLASIRLPLAILGTALIGSALLAAQSSFRFSGPFLGFYLDHLGSWLTLLSLLGAGIGLFLLLPVIYFVIRHKSGEPPHVADFFVAALLVLLISESWLTAAVSWAYPWGGVLSTLAGFAVLSFLRVKHEPLLPFLRRSE